VPIVRTAGFRVLPQSQAHAEGLVATFIAAVRAGEPGTRLILALQDRAEPTRITILTIFEDAEAEAAHNAAESSRTFGKSLNGHLAGGFSYLEYALVPGTDG
jgi:quinol monooxygenase YgiN